MKRTYKGFTLLELMIVIAIIGTLVAISLPVYQTYIKRSAYAELISAMDPLRVAIDLCYTQTKVLEGCDTVGGAGIQLPGSGRALRSISITQGAAAIFATPNDYKGLSSADTCTLTPVPSAAGTLTWTYSGPCLTQGYAKN